MLTNLFGIPIMYYADFERRNFNNSSTEKTYQKDSGSGTSGLEALIQHNSSDLSTWIPKEYELNKTYADDKVAFSEYLRGLREEIRKDTLKKIGE